MSNCWKEDPDDRPTFESLRGELKRMENQHKVNSLSFSSVSVFIVLHHLHHVTTDILQYIRTIIIPNKRTLHNEKKRKMCAVTKVA